jgi:hypothetical protein
MMVKSILYKNQISKSKKRANIWKIHVDELKSPK